MEINNLFNNFKCINNIFRGTVPAQVFNELVSMSEFCRIYKDSELSALRNIGNTCTSIHQYYIPFAQVNQSFTLPYINLCAQKFISIIDSGFNKTLAVLLKNTDQNILTYDMWVNYYSCGDVIHPHYHDNCVVAGIVFIKNSSEATYFENQEEIMGKPGDIILFPSTLQHWTKIQNSQLERVTISFNCSIL